MPARDRQFWDKYPGVVWSNPQASDSVMISNALLQGRLDVLKDAEEHFGPELLLIEWNKILQAALDFPEIQRVVQILRKSTEEFLQSLRVQVHA